MVWTGGMLMAGMLIEAGLGAAPKGWPQLPRPAAPIGRAAAGLERMLGAVRGAWALVAVAVLSGVAIAYLPGAPIWKVLIAAWLLEHRRTIDAIRAIANAFPAGSGAAQTAAIPFLGPQAAGIDDTRLLQDTLRLACTRFTDLVVGPAFWFLLAGLPGMLLSLTLTTARDMPAGATLAGLEKIVAMVPRRLSALLIGLAALKPAAIAAVAEAEDPAQTAMERALGIKVDPVVTHIAPAVGLFWRAWAVLLGAAGVIWVSF